MSTPAEMFAKGPNAKHVSLSQLPDGRIVSTVRLEWECGYETMIFAPDSWMDLRCERWSTRSDAEDGHARVVADESAACTKEARSS